MTSLADLLRAAADLAEARWHPTRFGIVSALQQAAGTGPAADDLAVDLWDAVVTHLNEQLCTAWEGEPGRTGQQVAVMLRAAADAQPPA